MAEFKISRLRFSWVGEWSDQKAYNKDEIVQYNGKAYVCLVPHTSNGFYTDLQATIPKWELMMTGQTWKGIWEQFTFYSLDNIVIFGGIVYKCNQEHQSGAALDTDLAKWDVYAESKTWQSEWTSSTLYGVGSIVQYGGSTYECIISHTSAATDIEGLETDYNDQLDSTQVKWKLLKEGVQYRSTYNDSSEDSSQIRYKLGDLVKYGPSVYKCIQGHVPSIPAVSDLGVYTSTAITNLTGAGSNFFKRELTAHGVRIVSAGSVGGQVAVPDAFIEKVARMFKLFLNKEGVTINTAAQETVIKTLRGDAGTWHAGLPTIQRVARGAGADYTPNFLTDQGIIDWNLSPLFDSTVANDMVWYLNSTGDGYGDGDNDAQEVIEHIFHTLHMYGLDSTALKLYPEFSADWATGPLFLAMKEAIDAGKYDPSDYAPNWETDPEQFPVAAKEYLYLLNFSMFEYTDLWEGGSLSPEWKDDMRTPNGIQTSNPLGYALYDTYIGNVIDKPSLATIRLIFQDGNTPEQDNPALAGVSGYVVTEQQEGGALENSFVEDYWELWIPGLDFDNVWTEDAIYQPGDIVLYGGYLYQSKIINNVNLTPSYNADDSSDAWELISKAFDMTGPWDANTEYKVGSVITYGSDLYVAIQDSLGKNPGNNTIQVGYEANGSSGTTIVVNTIDSVDPKSITTGMTVIGEGFARGQSVQTVSTNEITGKTTIVLTEAPDGAIADDTILTFAGTTYPYWELMIPGTTWKSKWRNNGVAYKQDDIVYWKNATYACIQEHSSALVNRPDNDFLNNYWILYLLHDQRNSLSDVGEMVIYTSGEQGALPIGDQSQVLKVTGGLPTWSDVDFTPNVYYVATNGVDSPERGTTPDTAWKSVKYACERVALGTTRQNEKVLLDNNKEWIIQEMFNWFLYQQNQNIAPFDTSVNFNNESTYRDGRFIVDGIVRDLTRNQTAETVRNALAYFDLESTNKFTNQTVADQAVYYEKTIEQLFVLIRHALNQTTPAQSYQVLEGYSPIETQYFNNSLTIDVSTIPFLGNLELILREPLLLGSPDGIPPANEGSFSTINIKSGTYEEELPIKVPARAALNGDELRGAAIKPKNIINTLCTRTFGDINQFIVGSTVNMQHNTPVQFVSLNPVDEISTKIGGPNIVQGITYYVIGSSITDTTFSVSATKDGPEVPLQTNIGYMYVYGGDALSDMIHVTNATGVRNMTLTGLLGTLTPQNQFETRRPSGGSFVSLDPGDGPDDTRVWITTRSPYIQNVTTFGNGCTGGKIDSTLHNGGNKSMTSNDFTQIISDGIGIWCTGGDALTECVSVFSYYNYAGYFAEDGGKIRATNGNSSYGQYGCIAEGFDDTEIPAVGNVNNRNNEATAEAVGALGANAEILKIQFSHAGEEYYTSATNMLKNSNSFLETDTWTTDGNINILKAPSTPFANQDAWKIDGVTDLTDSSYISQSFAIAPQGKTYTNVAGNNITGSGVDATFDVTVTATSYTVAVNNGGSGFVVGNQIRITGDNFGGRSPENDIVIDVATLSITAISTVTHVGIVPTGSALPYTFSIYAKQGNASYFDMYTTFSGFNTRTSYVRFNFDSETVTTSAKDDGGYMPVLKTAEFQQDGWWRISFTTYDVDAQNNSVELKIYPRGIDGIKGFTYFYGSQAQIGETPTFLLNTKNNRPSAYANINIAGAGSNAFIIADELRAESMFQTRVIEEDQFTVGGKGYKLQTNNAQQGNDEYITLAGSEVATAAEYEGMRLVLKSGLGAGQYGKISRYTPDDKRVYVLKESFNEIEIVSSNATSDRFVIAPGTYVDSIYPGQKIQFTPTYYNQNINSVAQNSQNVVATLGDLNNLMIVESTAQLRVGQKVNFTGTTFGGVTVEFPYYIINVVDDTKIQISTTLAGGVWPLTNTNIEDPDDAPLVITNDEPTFKINFPSNTSYLKAESTSDMRVAYPIQFTGVSLGGITLGTTYYIHEIYDAENFSIATNLSTVEVTDVDSATNELSILDTSVLIPMNPIIFKSNIVGGLTEDYQYWVKQIIDGTDFTITDTIVSATATSTEAISNLVTVDSTAGFVSGSPVIFTGTVFGGLVNDKVYYVQVVNDATSFTISETPAGSAVALSTATGNIITRTAGATLVVTDATGATMAAQTPGAKEEVESDGGKTMGSSFFTETYGGITAGATYYVLDKFADIPSDAYNVTGNWISANTGWADSVFSIEIDATPDAAFLTYLQNLVEDDIIYITDSVYGNLELIISGDPWLPSTPAAGALISIGTKNFSPFSGGVNGDPYNGNMTIMAFPTGGVTPLELQVSATLDGAPVALTDDTGSMQIGAVGWDHINPGTPAVPSMDSTSVYQIEPRVTFSAPGFTQTAMSALPVGWGYQTILTDGFTVLAVPLTGTYVRSTTDFANWNVEIELPVAGDTSLDDGLGGNNPNYNGGWINGTFGNNTWFIMSSTGQNCLYSVSGGLTWLTVNLPTLTTGSYKSVTYGNGVFVAIARDGETSAYSTDNCATWTRTNLLFADDDWVDIAYGNETFVAIDSSSNTVIYSKTNGETWNTASVDTSLDSTVTNWNKIEYGNGRFVATSTDSRSAVYSFDAVTWYASNLLVKGNLLTYGNGSFALIDSETNKLYQSIDGLDWHTFTLASASYSALGFTFDKTTRKGYFITIDEDANTSQFSIGTKALARPTITDGKITSISILTPGSGYTSVPTLTVTDPNNSEDALFTARIGDGVLGAPTFANQGFGYSTSSTAIAITGSGFSDSFQTGLKIVCRNITRVPQPGDNVEFEGNPEVYRVAKSTTIRGTTVPNLEAEIQLSPGLTQADTPAHDTAFTIRSRFSQVRLTNHDFLNIGFGNQLQSNYPLLPENTGLEPQDEVQETNNGRVFYSSTDQDGNFRVGDLFAVEQATGIVTLSADEFGLDGLSELSIGGVALGGSPVVVKAFSTDGTFTANSNQLVPTQRAIKTYLTSRLSQGGSDTFTGLLTAGTVKVGGPDEITSTVQEGGEGWEIKITTKANFTGVFGNSGWGGDGLALAYFTKTFADPTRDGQQ